MSGALRVAREDLGLMVTPRRQHSSKIVGKP